MRIIVQLFLPSTLCFSSHAVLNTQIKHNCRVEVTQTWKITNNSTFVSLQFCHRSLCYCVVIFFWSDSRLVQGENAPIQAECSHKFSMLVLKTSYPVETAVIRATAVRADPSWVGLFYVKSRYVVIVSARTYGNKAEIRTPDGDALFCSWADFRVCPPVYSSCRQMMCWFLCYVV